KHDWQLDGDTNFTGLMELNNGVNITLSSAGADWTPHSLILGKLSSEGNDFHLNVGSGKNDVLSIESGNFQGTNNLIISQQQDAVSGYTPVEEWLVAQAPAGAPSEYFNIKSPVVTGQNKIITATEVTGLKKNWWAVGQKSNSTWYLDRSRHFNQLNMFQNDISISPGSVSGWKPQNLIVDGLQAYGSIFHFTVDPRLSRTDQLVLNNVPVGGGNGFSIRYLDSADSGNINVQEQLIARAPSETKAGYFTPFIKYDNETSFSSALATVKNDSEEQWWLITFDKNKSWLIDHDKEFETLNLKSSGLNVNLSEKNGRNWKPHTLAVDYLSASNVNFNITTNPQTLESDKIVINKSATGGNNSLNVSFMLEPDLPVQFKSDIVLAQAPIATKDEYFKVNPVLKGLSIYKPDFTTITSGDKKEWRLIHNAVDMTSLAPAKENIPMTALTPAKESIPMTALTPAKESIPMIALTPAKESIPMTALTPAKESIPMTALTPAKESIPMIELTPAKESIPMTALTPAKESIPMTALTPAKESIPMTALTPAKESIPMTELTPAKESIPMTALTPAKESIPMTELTPAQENTPTAVDSKSAQIDAPTAVKVSSGEGENTSNSLNVHDQDLPSFAETFFNKQDNVKLINHLSNLMTLSQIDFIQESNQLNKRLGDIRQLDEQNGFWIKTDTGGARYENMKMNHQTIQMGGDKKIGDNIYGVMTTHTRGSTSGEDSEDHTTWGGGLYYSWVPENGLFIDVVGKYLKTSQTWFTDSSLKRNNSTRKEIFMGSVQAGWHLTSSTGAVFIEPSVELLGGYSSGFTIQGGDIKVHSEHSLPLYSKSGVSAGINWLPESQHQISLSAGIYKLHTLRSPGGFELSEYSGQSNNWLSRKQSQGKKDERYLIDMSLNARLSEKWRVYIQTSTSTGGILHDDYNGQLGLRYQF
ncbi:autotransporter outer membrane beta-barrel domain-containing protein, partial [Salmonella enterica subsp. enterica]|nr:autotransporter outer membrane beta-barrel domain-containing protein [Salmonella enterica subsp. enterica]